MMQSSARWEMAGVVWHQGAEFKAERLVERQCFPKVHRLLVYALHRELTLQADELRCHLRAAAQYLDVEPLAVQL